MPTTILDSESYTEALQHRCKEETKTEERINIIELAKKAGYDEQSETIPSFQKFIERFAALVRADLMKQVMSICEAEYNAYDKMVEEDDSGHEECCVLIHLMRKLEKLK